MSSHSGRPSAAMIKGQVLLCGNSHRELAQRVAQRLGIPLGACKLYQENCGETKIQIGESVRGKDVFIIQSGTRDPNNMMMELFILAYSCKTASAQRIVGVVPYLPYSKQCRMRKRGSIPCKLFANMMVKAGIQHLITMDLHMKEIQGFFSCPVDNLRASSFLIQYLKQEQSRLDNVVVVARHPGQARRATAYAERLRTSLSVIHGGEGVVLDTEATDGRSSPPLAAQMAMASSSQAQTPVTTTTLANVSVSFSSNHSSNSAKTLPPPAFTSDFDAPTDLSFPKYYPKALTAKKKPPINVVGDVDGKIALIVEDIIDDVEGFCAAARFLKERGARQVKVMCTHGLLCEATIRTIENSDIDEVIITNTVPNDALVTANNNNSKESQGLLYSSSVKYHKITVVDVSVLLSEGIRRIHNGESMSYLFRDIALDD